METGYVDSLTNLIEHLESAKKLLWDRVRLRKGDSPESALAALKAYYYVSAAIGLFEGESKEKILPSIKPILHSRQGEKGF